MNCHLFGEKTEFVRCRSSSFARSFMIKPFLLVAWVLWRFKGICRRFSVSHILGLHDMKPGAEIYTLPPGHIPSYNYDTCS